MNVTAATRAVMARLGVSRLLVGLTALVASGLCAPTVGAQLIRGTLMDVANDRPIDLGLVIMYTEAGDSITFTLTNERGSFSLAAPEPGSFILLASALGYRETPAGVFELDDDAEMTIEFRIRPQPVLLDEIIVALDRPVLQHQLVSNGFVRRLQRGLGHFITPYEIERSPARTTQDLFYGINGVTVRPRGGVNSFLGDQVMMTRAGGGWCYPQVFLDGLRLPFDPSLESIATIVPLQAVEAVEVYRRPSEVPIEYGITQGSGSGNAGMASGCGIMIIWTKRR